MLAWHDGSGPLPTIMQGVDFSWVLADCRDGRVLGAVGLGNWNPAAETIEVSAAITDPRFPHRAAVAEIARYVWGVLGCQAAVMRTDSRNLRARKWAKSLGAQEHIIPRLRGRTASEALLVITQEAWRSSRWAGNNADAETTRAA